MNVEGSNKTRVLIVDDSAIYRRIIRSALDRIPEVEVVGSALDGSDALKQCEELKPEIITLDVEMPHMDGVATLREIKAAGFDCHVIMVSALTARGASVTTEALTLGAFDFVVKPQGNNLQSNANSLYRELNEKVTVYRAILSRSKHLPRPARNSDVGSSTQTVSQVPALPGLPSSNLHLPTSRRTPPSTLYLYTAEQKSAPESDAGRSLPPEPRIELSPPPSVLAPKSPINLKMPVSSRVPRKETGRTTPSSKTTTSVRQRSSPNPPEAPPSPRLPSRRSCPIKDVRCVAIGISTGGPQALGEVLTKIPSHFEHPILIVQHMPPLFTKSLAEHLNKISQIRVVEAEHGMKVEGGTAYFAPGGKQMKIQTMAGQVSIQVTDDPPIAACKPSVDYLFDSLTSCYDHRILAIIMTGMGNDGFASCKRLRPAGARIYAQDEDTSTVYGMPKHVAEAGLADEILPLNQIANAILSTSRNLPSIPSISSWNTPASPLGLNTQGTSHRNGVGS